MIQAALSVLRSQQLTAVDGAAGAAAHELLQLVPVSSSQVVRGHVDLALLQI